LTLNIIELNTRIALELLEYDFELVHKLGKLMQHVDALSRNTNILVVETNSFKDNLIICQAKNEKLKDVRTRKKVSFGKPKLIHPCSCNY